MGSIWQVPVQQQMAPTPDYHWIELTEVEAGVEVGADAQRGIGPPKPFRSWTPSLYQWSELTLEITEAREELRGLKRDTQDWKIRLRELQGAQAECWAQALEEEIGLDVEVAKVGRDGCGYRGGLPDPGKVARGEHHQS